jgi:hypothetical protein
MSRHRQPPSQYHFEGPSLFSSPRLTIVEDNPNSVTSKLMKHFHTWPDSPVPERLPERQQSFVHRYLKGDSSLWAPSSSDHEPKYLQRRSQSLSGNPAWKNPFGGSQKSTLVVPEPPGRLRRTFSGSSRKSESAAARSEPSGLRRRTSTASLLSLKRYDITSHTSNYPSKTASKVFNTDLANTIHIPSLQVPLQNQLKSTESDHIALSSGNHNKSLPSTGKRRQGQAINTQKSLPSFPPVRPKQLIKPTPPSPSTRKSRLYFVPGLDDIQQKRSQLQPASDRKVSTPNAALSIVPPDSSKYNTVYLTPIGDGYLSTSGFSSPVAQSFGTTFAFSDYNKESIVLSTPPASPATTINSDAWEHSELENDSNDKEAESKASRQLHVGTFNHGSRSTSISSSATHKSFLDKALPNLPISPSDDIETPTARGVTVDLQLRRSTDMPHQPDMVSDENRLMPGRPAPQPPTKSVGPEKPSFIDRLKSKSREGSGKRQQPKKHSRDPSFERKWSFSESMTDLLNGGWKKIEVDEIAIKSPTSASASHSRSNSKEEGLVGTPVSKIPTPLTTSPSLQIPSGSHHATSQITRRASLSLLPKDGTSQYPHRRSHSRGHSELGRVRPLELDFGNVSLEFESNNLDATINTPTLSFSKPDDDSAVTTPDLDSWPPTAFDVNSELLRHKSFPPALPETGEFIQMNRAVEKPESLLIEPVVKESEKENGGEQLYPPPTTLEKQVLKRENIRSLPVLSHETRPRRKQLSSSQGQTRTPSRSIYNLGSIPVDRDIKARAMLPPLPQRKHARRSSLQTDWNAFQNAVAGPTGDYLVSGGMTEDIAEEDMVDDIVAWADEMGIQEGILQSTTKTKFHQEADTFKELVDQKVNEGQRSLSRASSKAYSIKTRPLRASRPRTGTTAQIIANSNRTQQAAVPRSMSTEHFKIRPILVTKDSGRESPVILDEMSCNLNGGLLEKYLNLEFDL